jgi:hypothetical protein
MNGRCVGASRPRQPNEFCDRDIRLRPAKRNDEEFIFRVSREALGECVDEIWGWRDKEQRCRQDEWLARTRVQTIELE